MRAPLSWLAEHVDLPAGMTGRELGEVLIRAGLEVETVETMGADITGPVVVGRVLRSVDEPQTNGKTIRWVQVDVGPAHNEPHPDYPETVRIKAGNLRRLMEELSGMSLKSRMERFGLREDRADVILPACFVYHRIAELNGSQANSSSRIHCTRTGRPGAARASKAASRSAYSRSTKPASA